MLTSNTKKCGDLENNFLKTCGYNFNSRNCIKHRQKERKKEKAHYQRLALKYGAMTKVL